MTLSMALIMPVPQSLERLHTHTICKGLFETIKLWVIPGIQTLFACKTPKPLNQIRVRRIGWQKQKFDASLLLYDVLSLGYRAWRMFLEIGFQGYPMFVQFAGHPLIAKLFELFDAARLIVFSGR